VTARGCASTVPCGAAHKNGIRLVCEQGPTRRVRRLGGPQVCLRRSCLPPRGAGRPAGPHSRRLELPLPSGVDPADRAVRGRNAVVLAAGPAQGCPHP
jgi:hypothetical protein